MMLTPPEPREVIDHAEKHVFAGLGGASPPFAVRPPGSTGSASPRSFRRTTSCCRRSGRRSRASRWSTATSPLTSRSSGAGRTSCRAGSSSARGSTSAAARRSSRSSCCRSSTRSRAGAGSPADFRDEELSPVERDVAEALLESGPISSAELPSRRRARAEAGERGGRAAAAAPRRHVRGTAGARAGLALGRLRHPAAALRRPARCASGRGRRPRHSRGDDPALGRRSLGRRRRGGASAARGSRRPRLSTGSPPRAGRDNAMRASTCSGLSSSGPSLPTPHSKRP